MVETILKHRVRGSKFRIYRKRRVCHAFLTDFLRLLGCQDIIVETNEIIIQKKSLVDLERRLNELQSLANEKGWSNIQIVWYNIVDIDHNLRPDGF